jgi:hypothetical protein
MRIPALIVLALTACGKSGDPAVPNPPPAPSLEPVDAAPAPKGVPFSLQVLDAATGQPVPGTLIVANLPSGAAVGGITSKDGLFGIDFPAGTTHAMVRTYFTGYASAVTDLDLSKPDATDDAGAHRWIVKEALLDATQTARVPKVNGFKASAAEVATDDPLQFDATVAAGDASDPIAEVILIEPNDFAITTLGGTGDGPYTEQIAAPAQAGTFSWYVVARTKGDVPSAVQAVTATVRSKKPLVHFKGTVVDGVTNQPLANAVVTLEIGGVYVFFSDASRPSPYYQYGGITASDGTFDVLVPQEQLGIHTFTSGYLYAGREKIDDPSVPGTLILSKPIAPEQVPLKPSVSAFTATPATVAAGATFVLSANVQKGPAGTDPLSDEIIVVQPDTAWCGEMAPPAPGGHDDYPDGTYSRTVTAPAKAGTYTYWLATSSAGCIISDNRSTTVTVQ